MTDANVQYRFLPWTRRGLSGAIKAPDQGGSLPARGKFTVGMTISNLAADPAVDLALYGPGDVLGIDPRLIVRCSPPANTSNYEANFFAAIEFDPPDFPWMFTPAAAGSDQRLRPWLVLIVLDRQHVSPPRVAGLQPLPTVTIPAEVAKQELPDLSEAWAWAHTQVVTRTGDTTPLADALASDPDANVSRLICPRRLQPNRQYVACLVPAFDAGVTRGLGANPDPARPLAPAWDGANPGKVVLPVYYHWEFATGPLGDFESLARKLKPFKCPDTVGQAPMYIGDGGPELPFLTPDQVGAVIQMDGALRSTSAGSAALEDVPQAVREGLAGVLNAPAEQLAGGPADATQVLGPPLYGAWPAKQFTISDVMPVWMRELNLDPRARVAAGLGSEVERKHQEDFMQACWEQVGEILKANQRLNWGRLGLEANRRAFERHIRPLPVDRLMQITGPVQRRVLLQERTVQARVRASSAPDALVDPAMRRTLSPQRPLLQKTVRRLEVQGRLDGAYRQRKRSGLVAQLSAGRLADLPTRYAPDGLASSWLVDEIQAGRIAEVAGIAVDRAAIATLRTRIQQAGTEEMLKAPLEIQVSPDIAATGVITEAHIASLFDLESALSGAATAKDAYELSQELLDVSRKNPDAQGILVTRIANSPAKLEPILLGQGGALQVRNAAGSVRVIGQLEPGTPASPVVIGQILRQLPPNTLDRAGGQPVRLGRIDRRKISIDGQAVDVHDQLHLKGLDRLRGVDLHGPGDQGAAPVKPGPTTPAGPGKVKLPLGPFGPHFPIGPVKPPGEPPGGKPKPPPADTWTIAMPYKEAALVQQFTTAVTQAIGTGKDLLTRDVGQKVVLDLAGATTAVRTRIDPLRSVPLRLAELVKLEGGPLAERVGQELGVRVTAELDRIMAYPELPAPAYQYLAGYDQERFCPGIGAIPPNSMTLLETNPRFIESFMVGLNHEMNRELLWREYPTDQRGTPFRNFWAWSDGQPDLTQPIHRWMRTAPAGGNLRGAGLGGQIVLLVRGELVRRYPRAVMLAWKAARKNNAYVLKEPFTPDEYKQPAFQGRLEPDIIFAGFDLRDSDLAGDGWFFLIQEQPTEPRFGFDQPDGSPPGPISQWRDASWQNVGVTEGRYLVLHESPLNNQARGGLTFGKDAAQMAAITLQQPLRVAIHSRFMQDLT